MLKNVLSTLIFVLIGTCGYAQSTEILNERTVITEVFNSDEYRQQRYRIFDGKVIEAPELNSAEVVTRFMFGSSAINCLTAQREFYPLFERGVIYPELLLSFRSLLNVDGRDVYTCYFSEIDYTNAPINARRYKITVFDNHVFGAQVFLAEFAIGGFDSDAAKVNVAIMAGRDFFWCADLTFFYHVGSSESLKRVAK